MKIKKFNESNIREDDKYLIWHSENAGTYYVLEVIKKYIENNHKKYDLLHHYYARSTHNIIKKEENGNISYGLVDMFEDSSIIYTSNDLDDCYEHLEMLSNINKYNL